MNTPTSISQDSIQEAYSLVEHLIDSWCARRALKPLGIVLQVYPVIQSHGTSWEMLYQSLEAIRENCQDDLTPKELEQLDQAIGKFRSGLELAV